MKTCRIRSKLYVNILCNAITDLAHHEWLARYSAVCQRYQLFEFTSLIFGRHEMRLHLATFAASMRTMSFESEIVSLKIILCCEPITIKTANFIFMALLCNFYSRMHWRCSFEASKGKILKISAINLSKCWNLILNRVFFLKLASSRRSPSDNSIHPSIMCAVIINLYRML